MPCVKQLLWKGRNMKVLHLIGGGDVGGAKVHVLTLVKELSKHIDVKIISFRHGAFAEDARDMGIDIEVVKTGSILSDVKKVVSIVKKGGYQLIHSHGAKANMIALFVKKFSKLPTVTTVHSDYQLDYMHSLFKRLTFGTINAVALRFIDYYVGVSNNFKEMLIERNFNPARIYTVYNGMDFDQPLKNYSRETLCDKYHLQLTDDDILVGIAARLYPVKGIDTLIEAAKLVIEKNPAIKFLIGGDGEQRKFLEQKAEALGVTGNVFFLGWLDDPYELMSCIDISVLTSISESFPYSVLEGARFGKATISSRVGGIPDLIDQGVNGYLFEPGDYVKLAEYILELAGNKEKRMEMGERILEKASSHFSLRSMCQTQLSIYTSVLHDTSVEKSTGKSYDIIISGYYGFKNIGDDALLLSIINTLKLHKKDIRVLVLSSNPLETKLVYGVNSISRLNFLKIIKAMKKASMFIYGGGTLIQESTSTRSLIYYLGTIWMAKKTGLKVMLYANGIEPINKLLNKRLTRRTVNSVDTITLREEPSRKELLNLGINKPVITVTADPALIICPAPEKEIDSILEKEGIEPNGPFIGFSARKWTGYQNYTEVIAKLADYMTEKHAIKPIFIPMQYPDDLLIIKSIVAKMKYKGYMIENRYDVPHTLGIIQRMEMLIGMRLHALVFAASLGIPVVGLIYEPKVEWFLQHMNQGEASAGNVEHLKYEALKEVVDNVWNNRTDVREKMKSSIGRLKEKALENGRIAVELLNTCKEEE